MKALTFLVLLVLIQTAALVSLGSATKQRIATDQGLIPVGHKKTVENRKLKENINSKYVDDPEHILLEDYRPVNPVPSSKASKHGTILRGTPLLPFVPKPAPPPTPPKHG